MTMTMTPAAPSTLSHRSMSPHGLRSVGSALLSTLFLISALLGFVYHANLHGNILNDNPVTLVARRRQQQQQQQHSHHDVAGAISTDGGIASSLTDNDDDDDNKVTKSYYIFLQKFPLQSTFRTIFHTEVIVCPRETFATDVAFLNLLDGLVENILSPSRFHNNNIMEAMTGSVSQDTTKVPFISIESEYWSKQSEPGCVQLGYGGADCDSGCCGSPHRGENKNYALNSKQAVIGNAMGDYKELYLYGISGGDGDTDGGISGEDAYKAVCHGHMNAIEIGQGKFPVCVSDWSGHDYNPLTNNCNTFTSTVLKCVYGLSDAKPHLGVSDLRTVTCPTEKNANGIDVEQCLIPVVDDSLGTGSNDGTTTLLLVK